MLFTLYTLIHGIRIDILAKATPMNNVIFLAAGSVIASFIGTTGASILLFRPFLEMNKHREKKAHLVVFFIFLVSNIGGLLTPLGDPPLLLGFIHGVDFFWCLQNLFSSWAIYVSSCLTILYLVDRHIIKKELNNVITEPFSLKITGMFHIFLTCVAVIVLFLSFKYSSIVLLLLSGISIINARKKHEVDVLLFKNVAVTFFVIFVTMAPVIFILNEHSDAIHLITGTSARTYFWLCGAASFFLDNAPSYLLFFNLTGESAHNLMHVQPVLLKAISLGAVVMGSMTYIGNAPNLMIRSLAIKAGIEMPTFIGYIGWASLVILPISIIITLFM
jgi:Na+/H+ antiporter NhaD/arsenite permease-like protein